MDALYEHLGPPDAQVIELNTRRVAGSTWQRMLILAGQSQTIDGVAPLYICRVKEKGSTPKILLKTNAQIQEFWRTHSSRNSICAKMGLNEIINITRIHSINNVGRTENIAQVLDTMSARAVAKYNGMMGPLRKIFSMILNFFIPDEYGHRDHLESDPSKWAEFKLEIATEWQRRKLPWIIGSNGDFARLVAAGIRRNWDIPVNQ